MGRRLGRAPGSVRAGHRRPLTRRSAALASPDSPCREGLRPYLGRVPRRPRSPPPAPSSSLRDSLSATPAAQRALFAPAQPALEPTPPAPLALPPRVRVLGLPVSATGEDDVVALAAAAVAAGRTLRIGVTNHNKCWLGHRDPAVRSFLEDADVVGAETSVVWAARALGREGVGAAPGVVLMGRLLERAHEARWSVYLLGARERVNRTLADKLRTHWTGARLVGRHHGYLSRQDEERVRGEVMALAPDLLLVAMGSPLQERFLASLPAGAGPRVRLGVGGGFDVHAGVKRDAPAWIRGSGMEWLWRSAQSPRLLLRYLVRNPWFVAAVLRERWAEGRQAPRA